MSGSKFASGDCCKSMWGRIAYHAASMSEVKTGETSAAPLAGAPRFVSARNSTIVTREQHDDRASSHRTGGAPAPLVRAAKSPQQTRIRLRDRGALRVFGGPQH
jgi:hypothetical protein